LGPQWAYLSITPRSGLLLGGGYAAPTPKGGPGGQGRQPQEMYYRNHIYSMTTKFMNRSVQAHPFHLVEASPWPIAVSFSLLVVTLSGVMTFQGYSNGLFLLTLGFISLVSTMTLWFKDISREGTFQGHHTFAVQKGLSLGFILFVISEVFFFISIFWAFFHSSLAPSVELGAHWPPAGIEALNP
jgi:cytochrome c oxidase subunit 3